LILSENDFFLKIPAVKGKKVFYVLANFKLFIKIYKAKVFIENILSCLLFILTKYNL